MRVIGPLKTIRTAVHHMVQGSRGKPDPVVEAKREEDARVKTGDLKVKVYGPYKGGMAGVRMLKSAHLDR